MRFDEYRSYDALGLAQLIRTGAVPATEVLEAALAAIEAGEPALNAMVHVDTELACAGAGDLPDGILAGVPFAIKDLFTDVSGMPSQHGCRLFAGAVAGGDAEIVRRYRAAGLAVVGKTNAPEFGVTPTTEPALTGATHNPWSLALSPGGSSGGAAAAVAAGYFPMAHATDGGGSIRIPAASCGLFGLKPTRARVSLAPDRGDGWSGMSSQHVVSRSVRDSAAALDATAGFVPGDPYAAPGPDGGYLAGLERIPGRLRLGIVTASPTGAPVAGEVVAAAEASARRCEALGHEVVPVAWPVAADDLRAVTSTIIPAHVAAVVDARLAQLGRGQQDGDLEPVTAMLVAAGRAATATAYVSAVQAMHRVGRAMATLFAGIDALLTPTLGRPPFPLGLLSGADPAAFAREVSPVAAFTAIANITGQPAMSLPLEQSAAGLPLGTQVIGRFGDETTLLRLAAQLEQAAPWFDRVPSWPLPA